jgi:hypothetical protein
MSEQHVMAGKVVEAEEIPDVVFPSSDEAAEIMHPREESFHLRALSVAAQLAPIQTPASVAQVGRDHLDVVFLAERAIERVRVVGLVADEPGGELVEEASGQNILNKPALGGEALSTDTARERLLPAATAMIFVPLPRLGPTAKPPFWRSRKLHPRTLLPDSAFPAGADAAPAASAPLPASRYAPTDGIGGGRSGTADASPASRAAVLRCPETRALRSAQPASHAVGGHDYPPAALAAAPAPPRPTVHRSVPTVLSRRFAVIAEQPQNRTKTPFRHL